MSHRVCVGRGCCVSFAFRASCAESPCAIQFPSSEHGVKSGEPESREGDRSVRRAEQIQAATGKLIPTRARLAAGCAGLCLGEANSDPLALTAPRLAAGSQA